MGQIFAHITATRVKWEATVEEMAKMEGKSVAEVLAAWEDDSDYDSETETIRLEDPMEEHGWVDRYWSTTTLYDSRNDVRPVVDEDESSEDLEEEVIAALGWLEGGYEDNGDGTFYASQSYQPYTEEWNYSYALHFVRKYHNGTTYVEVPWHPFRDGGIKI